MGSIIALCGSPYADLSGCGSVVPMSQDKTFHECGRIDCTNEGTAMPVLLLRATKGGVAAEAELDLRVCERHVAVKGPAGS